MQLNFTLANVVMLFRNISIANISLDMLKQPFNDEQPNFFGFDPVIISTYQSIGGEIIATSQNNRLEVKIVNPNNETLDHLSKLSQIAYSSISNEDLRVFGLNYFYRLTMDDGSDSREIMLEMFESSLDNLSPNLRGEIFSFKPQINYRGDDINYQLNFTPDVKNGKHINISSNISRDIDKLPSEEELTRLIDEGREYSETLVKRIFSIS